MSGANPVPLVSVLMPVYNAGSTLLAAADSILHQTMGDLELLMYDDGSWDDTAQVMEHLARKDRRARIVGRERVGLVEALRRLAAAARSELLSRMDADDVCHPRRFEFQVGLLETRPDLDLVATQVRCVPDTLVGSGMRAYVDWMNALVEPEDHIRDLFIESPLCHPSVLMRRRAYEAVGGYVDDGCPEDYGLWLRLHEEGCLFAKVPRVLLDWTESERRLTRTDGRYAPQRFIELKRAALLRGPLRDKSSVRIWGAGPTGKAWGHAMREAGIGVRAWLDVDPAKIGRTKQGAKVLSYETLSRQREGYYLLVAVGSREPRARIRAYLESLGFQEGPDYRTVS
jgi:glycosyltransferase involved in cell wall biosynthesis